MKKIQYLKILKILISDLIIYFSVFVVLIYNKNIRFFYELSQKKRRLPRVYKGR